MPAVPCIAFIESIAGHSDIPTDQVLKLLQSPQKLGQDSGFRGRISTQLFADEHFVLKLKTPYSLAPDKAIAWCRARLDKERDYGIYLAERHWLVLQTEQGCAVANVTPRHRTLDSEITLCQQQADTNQLLVLLGQLFEQYCRFWYAHDQRLDEGPTNFVVVEGELFYVDDDLYSHDDWVSLAHSLGSLLRRLGAPEPELGWAIGARLRQSLAARDPVAPHSLNENLAGVYLPEAARPALEQLRQVLCQSGPANAPAPNDESPAAPRPLAERLAIIADIHANLPALQVVLADLRREGIDQALVLGDVVGYGPHPAECIALLRQQPWIFVRGNHDHAMHLGEASERFSRTARQSIDWTLGRLSEADRQWLGTFDYFWRNDGIYAVHGAPVDASFMNAYVYQSTAEQNLDKLAERGLRLCFHGHSHIQGVWYRGPGNTVEFGKPGALSGRGPFLVCPGSVGLPRDGSTCAQYALFDRRTEALEFRELPYDRNALREAGLQAQLPDAMQRLFN